MDRQITTIPSYKLSTPSMQLLNFGRKRGWKFNDLGKASLPERPVHLEEWLIVPAHLGSSLVPDRVLERINKIYEFGYQPEGWLVIHKAPKLLAAPKLVQPKRKKL